MQHLPTGEPVWDLHYDENGRLTQPDAGAFLEQLAGQGVEDLFMMSHGWGTSTDGAQRLYDAMFPLIRQAATGTTGLGRIGFAGIYWPSLWFPPAPSTPPPASGSLQSGAGPVVEASTGSAALSGAEITQSLLPGFSDPVQQQHLQEIGRLIDDGQAAATGMSDQAKREQVQQIRKLLVALLPPPADGEFEDAGETTLLTTNDPVRDFARAAEVFGTVPAGSVQAVDWFRKALNGAKDAIRVLSYTTMKARAGDIGRSGLGPLLATLHARQPAVRVHLVGHSFGARLVSFALAGVGSPADSPVASLVLLQGAFSHWSFAHAQDNPFHRDGALHTVSDRVHGPLVATFTPFDYAVGVWYPRASFLSGQDVSAEAAGRWGGMGADGFQAVNPAADVTMPAAGAGNYGFTANRFYRVNAAAVINHVQDDTFSGAHSDIRQAPVAALITAAAAAHE